MTERDRNRVKLALALGWSTERVARAIDISPATLKRYFRAELKARDEMRDRLDLARMAAVAEKAIGAGDVGAGRALDMLLEKNDRRLYGDRAKPARRKSEDEEAPAKAPPLGKKAQADADAREVGGDASDWSNDLFPGGRPLN